MRMIDLSRELYHRTPTYPGQPPIIHGIWKTHEESFVKSGNVHGNCVMFFSMPDHGGTHIDAPRHFGMSGIPIDEYPLENCYVKGICLDLRHIAPKAEITPSDLEQAVKKSGTAIPKRGTVLLCTGHHARTFPTPAYSLDCCSGVMPMPVSATASSIHSRPLATLRRAKSARGARNGSLCRVGCSDGLQWNRLDEQLGAFCAEFGKAQEYR